ncbi:DUF1942 domain-containing protein [Mycobacterium sp. CVI_P3]|uniref:DUF1942 domain-containing protein n=1 Tax=Mycobacterium pinniadriaticum TaxID=2994102 RepID=A0ABT3SL66_9MYCO|nr:DUF1942 domain-containing protein [Mycobacterium pinniadriaticum]MCX2933824.1 DUF1942 domain-containing protein [Mycobacterium pinniadriaticum]MCX2940246.1 DUF1942 domain-containing protein [Mycobacterium pinniadriaticum]
MRGTRMSRVLVGLIAVALIATGCGGSGSTDQQSADSAPATSSAPSAKQAVVFGTAVDVASPDGATATYTVANLRPVPPDAQIVPAKGTMYAVDVTIVAKSGTTTYNGFWFVARAADGSNIAPAVGAVQPGITSGQLAQGQQIAAHVAYDVPQDQTITAIMLRDPHGKLLAVWATG